MECILLLFCLKVLYPQKLFFLRGNHEWLATSDDSKESFRSHIEALYKDPEDVDALLRDFMEVFSFMSLACLMTRYRILCIHGGIPRATRGRVTDLLVYLNLQNKPVEGDFPNIDGNNVITDLMWGDPTDTRTDLSVREPHLPEGFHRSPRDKEGTAVACTFDKEALKNFLKQHELKMVIRAHQSQNMGCYISDEKKLITVFSSSHYSGNNRSGALFLDDGTITVLTHAHNLGVPPAIPPDTPTMKPRQFLRRIEEEGEEPDEEE